MAMPEQEVHKLFNSWSSKSVASILVDGQKLNDVFGLIKQQLEYLLNRQNASEKKFEQYVASQGEGQAAVEPVVANAGPYTDPTRRSSMPTATFDPLLVESLRNEMDNVKLLARNNKEHVEKKIAALESSTHAQLQAIEQKLDGLSAAVKAQQSMHDDHASRLEQLEAGARQLTHMLTAMGEHVSLVEKSLAGHAKDASIQFHSIKDVMTVLELRAKSFESRVTAATTQADKLTAVVEGYPAQYFDRILRDIENLQLDKATRMDLESKADVHALFSKADQASVTALEVLAEELERRLANIKMESTEKFGHLDAKMDRRVDKMVAYCLKELRKELKAYATTGGEEEGPEGTDIGKVRCLVCNQTSNQRGNADIVFGGPQMKNTIRPRQRSNSPPPLRFPQSPPGPQMVDTHTGRPLPAERPDGSRHRASHSRLVKMGAVDPAVQEEGDAGDFNYRTSTSHKFRQAATRDEGDGTLVQITSKQHADGYRPAAVGASTPSRGTPGAYKDVEERLVNKQQGNPSNHAVKQVDVTMHSRPKSAPMRRTGSTSAKLLPMGLTTPAVRS